MNLLGIISGVGVGQLTATIGAYQSETSKAHRRGMLMSIELCLCAFGLFLAQWINYGFGNNDTAAAFQFPIYFQLVFLAITLVILPFLPESPRWLVSRGKVQEAGNALVQLGNKNTTHESPEIVKTMLEMEEIVRLENIDGWLWFKSLVSALQPLRLD
jgi:MFS family permease